MCTCASFLKYSAKWCTDLTRCQRVPQNTFFMLRTPLFNVRNSALTTVLNLQFSKPQVTNAPATCTEPVSAAYSCILNSPSVPTPQRSNLRLPGSQSVTLGASVPDCVTLKVSILSLSDPGGGPHHSVLTQESSHPSQCDHSNVHTPVCVTPEMYDRSIHTKGCVTTGVSMPITMRIQQCPH